MSAPVCEGDAATPAAPWPTPGTAPAKLCACVGIRSCKLCGDPELRLAHGMHPIREAAPGPVAELCYDANGGISVHFGDGRVGSREQLPVPLTGFELLQDIVEDEAAEEALLREIHSWPWQPSQSGRWKQDFGPKANFKGKKVKVPDDWRGFPPYAKALLERICERCPTLKGFEAAECLLLQYDSERGANHALHVDDTWLWGERIIGVCLGSESVFTFCEPESQTMVRAPLPRRSAYVLSGNVRYLWQHGILPEDIQGNRVAMTFRELTPEIASSEAGKVVLARAKGTAELPQDAEPGPPGSSEPAH